jgi:hypothetical protein
MVLSLLGREIAHPPDADAGLDIDLSCADPWIHLDGSGSHDPDGDISTYLWSYFTADGDFRSLYGRVKDIPMDLEAESSTLFSLTVIDSHGLADSDDLVVEVGPDDQPPLVESIDLLARCLWPANHEKVKFRLGRDITWTARDPCGSYPLSVKIVGATSSQPESFWAEPLKTEDDITFTDTAVCMRAERSFVSFENFEREYTIVIEFSDAKRNSVQREVKVKVPWRLTGEQALECGDLASLDFVEDPDQECLGSEGQYPPTPPPPWGCPASIVGEPAERAPWPVAALLFVVGLLVFLRRRR